MSESVVFARTLSEGSKHTHFKDLPVAEPAWIHFDALQIGVEADLLGLGVTAPVVERLLASETRPRLSQMDDGLLLILRGINLNLDQDPVDMISLRIWVQGQLIITVRRQPLASIQEVRRQVEAGDGPKTVQGILIHILAALADRASRYIDGLTERVDALEDALETSVDLFALEISDLRRQIASLRRFIAPQRDALFELSSGKTQLLSGTETDLVRDQADRFTRYVEDLELIRERASFVQEALNHRLQDAQNKRGYLLSLVAGLFLPATLITGIFGMNVGGLPGVDSPAGFFWVVGSMFGLSLSILLWFQMRRWW
ncbi:zinc transporter ZntB [Pseudomonadales bacterium]|nr:zinc transporter ZntB [Pseudomonadales bacterium]